MRVKKLNKTTHKGNRTTKELPCKECGNKVDGVDLQATGILCWRCVAKLCGGKPISDK